MLPTVICIKYASRVKKAASTSFTFKTVASGKFTASRENSLLVGTDPAVLKRR
jgi:hypothetical protein